MKSPHQVNRHRKPQLHVQSQGMQAMDLVLEAIFRPIIKTVRNIAAGQTTKTIHRSPGATIQGEREHHNSQEKSIRTCEEECNPQDPVNNLIQLPPPYTTE